MTSIDNDRALSLHEAGLEASLAGRFDEAKTHFDQAGVFFEQSGDLLNQGRVERDMARVHAGLGREALDAANHDGAKLAAEARDSSVDTAVSLHRRVYAGRTEDLRLAAAELAASLHVKARVLLAHTVECAEADKAQRASAIDEMYTTWEEAFHLATRRGQNADYIEQIVAHGALAIAAFGSSKQVGLAFRMRNDETAIRTQDPDRVRAMKSSIKIYAYRTSFLPAPRFVKKRVAKVVAGAYMVTKPTK